jgi:threonine aldolase
MKKVMIKAELCDDVFGEDPSVIHLERELSTLCGKDAGLFVCSGTMSNQLGLRVHLQPMQSIICDSRSHIFRYESTGVAHLSQALILPVEVDKSLGYLTAERVASELRFSGIYCTQAETKVISLEIPLDGIIMPFEEIKKIHELKKKYPHLRLHLDGARLWNALVAERRTLYDYCQFFDTVSLKSMYLLCFSLWNIMVLDFTMFLQDIRSTCRIYTFRRKTTY